MKFEKGDKVMIVPYDGDSYIEGGNIEEIPIGSTGTVIEMGFDGAVNVRFDTPMLLYEETWWFDPQDLQFIYNINKNQGL